MARSRSGKQLQVAIQPASTSPSQARPIGRGAKVRRAVLAATLAELTETGYAGLTVENVAQRAGVHKTTIYRRWQERARLVTDAVIDLATSTLPIPDSHDIDTDLRAFARGLVGWLNSPTGQAVVAVLASDAARLPQVAEAKQRFFRDRIGRAAPLVQAAIDRGQLPTGTDPAALLKTLIAPIYLRLLVTAEPITEATADTAARIALTAARAGLLTGQSRPS